MSPLVGWLMEVQFFVICTSGLMYLIGWTLELHKSWSPWGHCCVKGLLSPHSIKEFANASKYIHVQWNFWLQNTRKYWWLLNESESIPVTDIHLFLSRSVQLRPHLRKVILECSALLTCICVVYICLHRSQIIISDEITTKYDWRLKLTYIPVTAHVLWHYPSIGDCLS